MTNWNEDDLPDEDEDEPDIGPSIAPGEADYDLSEGHGYSWEPPREGPPLSPMLVVLITTLVIAALVLPSVVLILRYS